MKNNIPNITETITPKIKNKIPKKLSIGFADLN